MKRIFVLTLVSCALMTACSPRQQSGGNVAPFPRDPETTIPTNDPQPQVAPAPTPTPVPANRRDASYGIPEPGRPGFIRSPHSPEKGLIDVRGYPPGTEIKDPYMPGKIILVP